MKRYAYGIILLILAFVTTNLMACSTTYYRPIPVIEAYPFMKAYSQNTVMVGKRLYLDGVASYDPDGGILTSYIWTIPSGATGVQNSGKFLNCVFETPGTYTFELKVRDNEGMYSSIEDTLVVNVVMTDTTPPNPNPMNWLIPPRPVSKNSISMTAASATDDSGVEYFFSCTEGKDYGGDDSGWQDSPIYEDGGLQVGVSYSYTVKARDKSILQNETSQSITTSSVINSLIYVDPDSSGTQDGSNWDNAYHTIQDALDSAVDNDVVVIRAYREYNVSNLDFGGKAIVLTNEKPWEEDSLVLNGNGDSVFVFNDNEGPSSVLNGFTLSSGVGINRAVLCQSSSPTFINCKFTSNEGGGAILVKNTVAEKEMIFEMFDCKFTNNSIDTSSVYPDNYGGGLFVRDTSQYSVYNFVLQNCDFIDNGYSSGGVLSIILSSSTQGNFYIRGCKFNSNKPSTGAVYASSGSASQDLNLYFDDCLFEKNYAKSVGAIRGNNVSEAVFNSCAFIENRYEGGYFESGIIKFGGNVTCDTECVYDNCVFAYNKIGDSTYYPDGNGHSVILLTKYQSSYITNCLFYDNEYDIDGRYEGINEECVGTAIISNTIFWTTKSKVTIRTGNQANSLPANLITAESNIFYPDYPRYWSSDNIINGGNNAITDPEFVREYDMDGLDDIYFTADDGLLTTSSSVSGIGYGPSDNDIIAPTPNPIGWEVEPCPVGLDSISMEAESVSDVSNVEYYFICTEGGGHDSGWQQRNTYKDTGLVSGREYSYIVMARDRSIYKNVGSPSLPVTVKTYSADEIPSSPSVIEAAVKSNTQVRLSWNMGSGYILGYELQRMEVANVYETVANLSGSSRSYLDESCSSGTQYLYRICAYNDAGSSEYIDFDTVTTQYDSNNAPVAPTNLVCTVDSDSQITLQWSDNSGYEFGYIVQYKNSESESYQDLVDVGENVTTYVHCGCLPSTTYYYRICAWNSAGSSSYAVADYVTTSAPIIPSLPDNVQMNELSEYEMEISWSDNSDNEDGFIVQRKVAGGDYEVVGEVLQNVTSFVDSTYDYENYYIYRVLAYNVAGNGVSISTDQITEYQQPGIPANVYATSPIDGDSCTEIELTWNAVSGNVTYNVYRSECSEFIPNQECLVGSNIETTNYLDTNLLHSTTYYYQVRAVSEYGVVGDYSIADYGECATYEPLNGSDSVPPAFSGSPWTSEPESVSSTQMVIDINEATDDSGVVEYCLIEVTGQAILYADQIDWQLERRFELTGLSPNTDYTFAIQVKDAYGNKSELSDYYQVTTLGWDQTPPEFSYEVWAVEPYSSDPFTVTMKVDYAKDIESEDGVEYRFDRRLFNDVEIYSSDWQFGRDYSFTGLVPGTLYECRVVTRDDSDNILESEWEQVVTLDTNNCFQVIISPEGAIESGCKWRVTGTDTWYESGDVISGLTLGTNVIEFFHADGWDVIVDSATDGTISYENTGSSLSLSAVLAKSTEQEGYIYVPKDYDDLEQAIDAAVDGDTVILSPGIHEITYDRQIKISEKSITIRSENPAYDFENQTTIIQCNTIFRKRKKNVRAFELRECTDGNGITIMGLTFKGGSHKVGGAIFAKNAKVNINYCNFKDNNANNGGAIYTNSDINIENSFFQDNSIKRSKGVGGAISLVGNNTYSYISSSEFNNNNARNGGAIYCVGKNGIVEIIDNVFNLNCASNGGSIFFKQEELLVYSSDFTTSNASKNGGAIYAVNGYLSLADSTFSDCVAKVNGGAVFCNSARHSFCIERCEFVNNSSRDGGTVFAKVPTFELSESEFSYNNATSEGGALYLIDSSSRGRSIVKVDNKCIFNGNSADTSGGAIYIKGCLYSIENSVFDSNMTNSSNGDGGAIASISCNYFTIPADITNFEAGIRSSIFYNNYSNDKGGAIYDNNSETDIINTIFSNNSSAIYNQNLRPVTINNCIMWGNQEDITWYNSAAQNVIDISESCVESGWDSDTVITTDPGFVDIDNFVGSDGLYLSSDDGLLLDDNSPVQSYSSIYDNYSNSNVKFNVSTDGVGNVIVSFMTDSADGLPIVLRSFALKISTDNTDVYLNEPSDVQIFDNRYDIFMDYSYNNPDTYSIGMAGSHPVARVGLPGSPTETVSLSEFSVNFGSAENIVFENGVEQNLLIIMLNSNPGSSATITIGEDSLRDSFYGLTTNLPQEVTVTY